MGAGDSKLVFRRDVFRLFEQRNIPVSEGDYWSKLWVIPESQDDIFSLISPSDIKRIQTEAPENLETLLLAVTSRLYALRHDPKFPSQDDSAPAMDALNCIRLLTRFFPFLHEGSKPQSLSQFWWGSRRRRKAMRKHESEGNVNNNNEFEEAQPLAQDLIDIMLDFLFWQDFTISAKTKSDPPNWAVWQIGVGCSTAEEPSNHQIMARTEILRFLITMISIPMFNKPDEVDTAFNPYLTYIVSRKDRKQSLTLLCSLLNTTINYRPLSWLVPYNHYLSADSKYLLVNYSVQVLTALLVHCMHESKPYHNNIYRTSIAKLHRKEDFQLIADGFLRLINQPLSVSSSVLPGSYQSIGFIKEQIILFWQFTEINRKFLEYLVDTGKIFELIIILFGFIHEYKLVLDQLGLVRICSFYIHNLVSWPIVCESLGKTSFKNHFPVHSACRIPAFSGSYADFVLLATYMLIATSKSKLSSVYSTYFAIITNVMAFAQNLSITTSFKLMRLFSVIIHLKFLLANKYNYEYVVLLLNSFNSVLTNNFSSNENFIYALFANRDSFETLRNLTVEQCLLEIENHETNEVRNNNSSSNQDSSTPFTIGHEDSDSESISDTRQLNRENSDGPKHRISSDNSSRILSEKARGKLPEREILSRQSSQGSVNTSLSIRRGSTDIFNPDEEWLAKCLSSFPLTTIINLLEELQPLLSSKIEEQEHDIGDNKAILSLIRHYQPLTIRAEQPITKPFVWSHQTNCWLLSAFWGSVFSSDNRITSGLVSIWRGTDVRLFHVQNEPSQGPSLMRYAYIYLFILIFILLTIYRPRGAVDASINLVTKSLSQRLSLFRRTT